MITYRQLFFWMTAAVASSSIASAQLIDPQPAAVPVESAPASAASNRESAPAEAAEPQPTPGPAAAAPAVENTPGEPVATPAAETESPARIAIIELAPEAAKSEIIRKVVELLEREGVAKRSSSAAATKTTRSDLSARIAATSDVKTSDVLSLVKSLQGHGIVRMSFTKPSNDRSVVTVQAPADTPWPVIDNIRAMVTAKKGFSVDVQIAAPNQFPVAGGGNSASQNTVRRRYTYAANSDGTAVQPNQFGSRITNSESAPKYASSTPAVSSGTTAPQDQQPEQETRIFMLKYADSTALSKSVAQLFDDGVGIVADARTNSVIVRGAPSRLREMEALVEMLDSQQPQRPVAQAFRPANPDAPLRQVLRPLNSIFTSVENPAAAPAKTRAQIEQLEKHAQAAAETLRTLKSQQVADGADITKDEDNRRAVLRDAVRQTFLARQNLQRAELAEFAARMNRIQQTIEMRDKIADKIIDRRVEELLDPNLKWDQNSEVSSQNSVVRKQTVTVRGNGAARLQPAPQQKPASDHRTVVVAPSSDEKVILRKAEEFRQLLATHARRVAQVQASIEAWKARYEEADDNSEADDAIKAQQKQLAEVEADRNFAMKEYETQIRLLESEVETSHLVLEAAKQELERTTKLVKAAALPSHEVDKSKRELIAAEQQVHKARILLDLYREAAEDL